MSLSRLTLALDGALPASGDILVFGARAGDDLSVLPRDRVRIVQGFRPDHDAWEARGYRTAPDFADLPEAAAAVVFLPRARGAARDAVAMVAAHVVPGGPVWIDGQKTDGIDTMLKDIRARVPVSPPIAKAHGKIFRFDRPADEVFADWRAGDLSPAPGFVTRPGVFSAEAVDRGSALLAAALPARLGRRVADFGAGWGWLSAQILTRAEVEVLDLVEADHLALACARRNVTDPRAQFHWADATRFRPAALYDAIVTNPPFHTGRAAEPALGLAFIAAAADRLQPSATLWLVANRHLPYEKALSQRFREVEEVGGDNGFKVLRAARVSRRLG
ncbi:MAG: class I SAM-dependent methyltransferase [Albidovulum sp.]